MAKDLGKSTAYAYYVDEGGTKTPEEFGEMLVNIDTVATRAETSATNAAQSAQQASQSAQSAESAKQTILSATVTVTPVVSDGNLTFNAAIEGGN